MAGGSITPRLASKSHQEPSEDIGEKVLSPPSQVPKTVACTGTEIGLCALPLLTS